MTGTHRFVRFAGLLVGILSIACIDMSAPKGPAAISSLVLPSPSVVVGDTMRDSTGKASPLTILAYDKDGNVTIPDAQFFITDSVRVAHLGTNNIVVGDKLGTVHIIGQIGLLQTQTVTIPVTVAPTKIAAQLAKMDTLFVPVGVDSATSLASTSLAVTLKGASDSTAQGFRVTYAIVHAPATAAGKPPAVYLADDQGHLSSIDTSDASGASRHLYVNQKFIADPAVQAGTNIDSAVVTASAFYKGAAVPGSPITFVVPIHVRLPQ